jgi:hypothetical protein
MGKQVKLSKKRVSLLLALDDGRCHYCGIKLVKLSHNEPLIDSEGTTHYYRAIKQHRPRLMLQTKTAAGETRVVHYPEGYAIFTVDHKVCQAHGGTNDIDNLVAACFSCNVLKGARYDYDTFRRMKAEGIA